MNSTETGGRRTPDRKRATDIYDGALLFSSNMWVSALNRWCQLNGRYLGSEGRCGELRDDGGQQAASVWDQVRRKQLHFLPQTLPHWQHHDHQHLLQHLAEAGHAHEVLLGLRGRRRTFTFLLTVRENTFSYQTARTCRTHVAQFLHVGHEQGEAVSEGRVILCADLFDQRAQQHLAVVGDRQDGRQLDWGVAKSRHHSCKQAAAGCSKIGLSNVLKMGKDKNLWHCLLWEPPNNDSLK